MAAVKFACDWTSFIMDTSGKSDQELFDSFKNNWDVNGYAATVDAITAKDKEFNID